MIPRYRIIPLNFFSMANTSRVIHSGKAKSRGLSLFFWLPVIFFSLILVYNTLPYFSFDSGMSFLKERAVLYAKSIWRWSFYLHIAAGSICILAALIQFSSWILQKRKRIHLLSGKIYVFVVLFVGAPSGFYMTFFAKGGFGERICFMAMAVFWFYSTYRGFLAAARDKNFLSHKFWMIRSYAMALTAVTFRIYHILFLLGGLSQFDNYAVSLWISVLGNAWIAETIIASQSKTYSNTFNS